MSDLDADTRKLIEHLKNNPIPSAKKTRGPGKKPARIAVTVRFDPEVVLTMKETGPGWQRRMNDIIKNWIENQRINQAITSPPP
jgi:uncharacterized protein (DUF4415 family)